MNKLLTAALLLGASSIGAAPASAVTTSVDGPADAIAAPASAVTTSVDGPADAIADQQTVDVDMGRTGPRLSRI